MKIYLSSPRYHWISPYTILEHIFFWKPWSEAFREKYSEDTQPYPEWVETASEYLMPISKGIQWILNKIHPEINYIKIDGYDTWSMDHTLSPIIHKMLVQLREHKHGYGMIDDEDVPKHLRSIYAFPPTPWEWDGNAEARYNWVLDEMIWTFEQLASGDGDSQFYDHSEVDPNEKDINVQISKMKVDREGLNAHNARIDNGLRLFGCYFRSLWD